VERQKNPRIFKFVGLSLFRHPEDTILNPTC